MTRSRLCVAGLSPLLRSAVVARFDFSLLPFLSLTFLVPTCGCGLPRSLHRVAMDPWPGLWSSLRWGIGLVVVVSMAVMAVVWVRRWLGLAGDEMSSTAAIPPDWIPLLTGLQSNRLTLKPWIHWAPQLVAQSRSCPKALRVPLIAALDVAISTCRDPLASASMVQVRAALAALPGV